MEQKLHTPEGVRDIYHSECRRKLAVQRKLRGMLYLYGYQDIQTPTFEYFDVFRKEIGTIPSRELYKFFDKEGNTLVLRPDLTPSIARAVATLFEEETFPIRLCYVGNTFINHSSYRGRLKENTQLGAELIGVDSAEADAEIIAAVVDGLKKVGLNEFQVTVGHVDFIRSLMEATGLDEDGLSEIHALLSNKNYLGIEEILEQEAVPDSVREAFGILPELIGGQDVLQEAKKYAHNHAALKAIDRLEKLFHILTLYGAEDHITFDFSMCGNYGYYSGIIFSAYTYGTGDAVVRGGRYDHLLEKFGKNTPSIGFAIIIDELLNALNRQKIAIESEQRNLIVYTDGTMEWAISLATEFRSKGKRIELLRREITDRKENYVDYGKRTQAISMLYLRDDRTIDMVNLQTGEEKIVYAGKAKK